MTIKFNELKDGTYFRVVSDNSGHPKDTVFVKKTGIPNIVKAFRHLTALRKSDNKAWALSPDLEVEIIS